MKSISSECNSGEHYKCFSCQCSCHNPNQWGSLLRNSLTGLAVVATVMLAGCSSGQVGSNANLPVVISSAPAAVSSVKYSEDCVVWFEDLMRNAKLPKDNGCLHVPGNGWQKDYDRAFENTEKGVR